MGHLTKPPLQIYFLDDEAALCEAFADTFGSDTVTVTTFSNSTKLIEQSRKVAADVYFLDYRLPGTTGEKVAAQLATQKPIILVTGELQVETEYPFFSIVQKPFRTGQIEELLGRLLSPSDTRKC